MSLLEVKGLTKNFGGLSAVSNVSLKAEKGELIGLIGPNGAGKTTFFNLLTGVYVPTEGTIELETENGKTLLNGIAPNKITELGLARTFQNIRLFKDLTVLENVMVAMHAHKGNSLFSSLFRTKAYYETEKMMKEEALELLKIFNLESFAQDKAKNLAYGQQRELEIVRALATKPKILFLDEPAAGMNPQETANLTKLIAQIQEQFGLTVVLIEHDMSLVMEICQRLYVLEYGRLLAHGTPEEIKKIMLEVKDLSVHYGMIQAVKDVSFTVNEGEIVSLIGANGAGKSTILKTLSGLVRPSAGTIEYLGQDITKLAAKKIVSLGLAQVPEGRHVFRGLSVKENLDLGAFLRNDKEEIQKDMKAIFERFPILEERKNQDAATLSGGEQQMLAMGRALMTRPKLLLLDEPSMGLAPIFIKEIFNIIQEIQKQGTTVLLIEQNAKMALSIASRGYVLETGSVVLSGTGKELLESEDVQKAYLGG